MPRRRHRARLDPEVVARRLHRCPHGKFPREHCQPCADAAAGIVALAWRRVNGTPNPFRRT